MLTGDSHFERVFDGEDFAHTRAEKVEFTDCTFRRCVLTEARFKSCRFQACTFTECDLSLLQVPDSTFSEVRLVDSKVIGVDWAAARWPEVSLGDPIAFERCVLSHSTFLGLSLGGLCVTECTAREVDFREADLGGADFAESDLTGCLFSSSDLRKADFSRARNYAIPPAGNRLEGAKFSLPEALSFLHVLGIDLVDGATAS